MPGTLNPGDRVLIPEPNYSAYADAIRLTGAEPVYVRQTADFHLDFESLEAGVAIRGGTEDGPSGQHHIRITFATDRKRLTEGVLRLRSMLRSL